ncbi:hypothetical protein [Agromyces marinus]|uniref:DUF2231 domain-containing protein n=1 Tax=Agromyces marinus TaxID=1389020 RepID=A0ABM8H5Y1_9MICO|nr:hypothetical protein [Agromyces marinus]UIP58820.1 hypothetical protein DSM26151_17070 [Agromyces marinus]BDZ56237.1 hypothetical protein GCM10025870_33100 [Agromyces marinus]
MSDLLDFQVAGLPAHVLLVHAVVIGVPVFALLLILIAAWPAARRVLWLPALIGSILLLGLVLVTVSAGEWLADRVPETPLIEAHTDQGDDLTPWIVGMVAVAAFIGVVALLARRQGPGRRRPAVAVLAALSIVAAVVVGVGSVWTVVLIGEAGSRAVWEGSFSEDPLEER